MYVWSKALTAALVVTLWGYGPMALQAKDHKNQSCAKPQSGCPAPVIQTPMVESSCCPIPTVQNHCAAPVQTGCCGVIDNSKDIDKARKEALHAHHEAQEACQKRQKAIAKAQHEIDEKVAKQQARIDRANDHFNHEVSEFQEANAKYESFYGGPSEAVAEVTPQPQPAPEITQRQPEPAPAPIAETTPQQPTVEEQVAIVELPPAPAPVETAPKELPRTASPMSLIGLIGLLSMSGYTTLFFRR